MGLFKLCKQSILHLRGVWLLYPVAQKAARVEWVWSRERPIADQAAVQAVQLLGPYMMQQTSNCWQGQLWEKVQFEVYTKSQ